MTISYNWLSDYLPVALTPERLSHILTAIGLEVEKAEPYEEVRGGLKGLIIGEVLEAVQHPNADKLKITKVTIGAAEPLDIVCGAPNVAAGQKVVVAPIGATIYPTGGEPLTMKKAKIRGTESEGMICAEDEIGLGTSHAGILILPDGATVGMEAAQFFKPYNDVVFEIGLTPNRADAMSHWGVARDVCAYLSHHDGVAIKPIIPTPEIKNSNNTLPIKVVVENTTACPRYSGVCIAGVHVGPSPLWLQQRLKSIGLRPINNIVDVTNFILHETGQPLHAFDYDAIKGNTIIVKNEAEATTFKTLDEKDRKLSSEDLMICDVEKSMCIAGVFGGLESGVTNSTKNIFLESAFFDPGTIRKTSFRHGLRTDAATRFEKGVDISNTVAVLKRAAALIIEVAGGAIASPVIDEYPQPEAPKQILLKYEYLKKLSGKWYPPAAVKSILQSLGFIILEETETDLTLQIPPHKRDIAYGADLVEEILRIDGLDAIQIPTAITLTPQVEKDFKIEATREKVANTLVGMGFTEILTNSITASTYFSEAQLSKTVKLLNNLSSELDVLRPAMLPTALEVIAFNHNRKNNDLALFEFGKTYTTTGVGTYNEATHLCIYITGNSRSASWKEKAKPADIYYVKGVAENLLRLLDLKFTIEVAENGAYLEQTLEGFIHGEAVLKMGKVSAATAQKFGIKQAVYFANFNWDHLLKHAAANKIRYAEVSKFPAVERDLAMVVSKNKNFEAIKKSVESLRLSKLQEIRLFDVFESDKLGLDKKSLAVNFTFSDREKTLTDKEIDDWMNKIMKTLETEAGAEIRKG